MKKSLFLLGLLAIIGLIFSILVIRNYDKQNLPLVEIWLGQPLALIKGYDWPRYKEDGQLFDVAWIDKPIQLKLHLPSGREITTISKGTWIGVETNKLSSHSYTYAEGHDPINHVSILPLLESVRPDELTAHLDKIAVNLALRDDPNFDKEWDSLETQARLTSKCTEFGFQTALENKATVSIRTQTASGFFSDGCYLVIDIWWDTE